MTFLYTRSHSFHGAALKQHPDQDTINLWKHLSDKANWRIVQLPNGFYQTEYQDIQEEDVWNDVTRRETLDGAETAIDGSVEHYGKRVEFSNGPKVVKTFK